MLHLQLFGGFKLSTDDGQLIAIRLMKDRALLTYLAMNQGKLLSRSFLVGLLWSEQPDDKARHSLSQSLSSICDTLSAHASIITRGRKEISIQKGAMQVDMLEFFSLSAEKNLDARCRAFDLYQADTLNGFDFSEPEFDDWINDKKLAAEQAAIESGLQILSLSESTSDTRVAQKIIQLDSFCEVAHQQLIRQHVKSGNMKLAFRQFEICEKILFNELGIDPSPETRRAMEPSISRIIPGRILVEAVEKPACSQSLVVMPIDNISGDTTLDYLSFGLADDITTELTRFRDLFVISRESAFGLDITRDTSPAVCLRLGVRHCLRGAFRRIGSEFRVNLHLVDGETGQSVWSERYDLSELELLALPGEITRQIVGRLASWLERDALTRICSKPTGNWHAYDHLLKGLDHHHQSWYSTDNLKKAIRHFQQAIKIDPGCARAYAYLACAKSTPYFRRHDKSLLKSSRELALHAVNLDPTESEAHRILGGIYLCHSEHDLSRQYFIEAEDIHPGNAHILAHVARYYIHTDQPDKAIELLGRARQLNPAHPPWYWEHMGMAYFGKRQYFEALNAFSRLQHHSFYDQLYVSSANALHGNQRAASHHMAIALRKNARLCASNVSNCFPYSKPEDLQHLLEGLKLAGLPD